MKNFFLKTNVFILFFLGFISCNKDDEEKIIVPNPFVGEWEAVWDEYTGYIPLFSDMYFLEYTLPLCNEQIFFILIHFAAKVN